ncbi:Gfo/Idh/MocA family protein [Paenibacillus sp. PAMC21692]|uniref:Gfo/Idh/MocA family protein n=1 Tax=Paenibacillus sp. PAMC21692 TaxID=2762320 RepID=UPI00164DA28C|nr:Gfo/Idh/MocA family oxidoreductase [Paenibacillus sp. PAMC21692]QNK57224.1 Gfo/Idh/MocA family oxidoreductase [Paenibacillus sp. PAMC21692]
MKTLRLGIVGCGVMGDVYLKAASSLPSAECIAVADSDEAQATTLASRYGVDTVYSDAEQLFADARVHAVILAIPTRVRTNLALRALQAGKHVLLEKPVALNAADVQTLIRARGSLIAACCSSRLRLQRSARAVAGVLASGAIGELRIIRSCWQFPVRPRPEKLPPKWRLSSAENGGGNMANLGSYILDYLLGVLDWQLEPELVFARTWGIPDILVDHVPEDSDGESLTSAMITFRSGPALLLEQGESFIAKQADSIWKMIGTTGTLSFQILPSTQRIVLERYHADQVIEETVWEGSETFPMAQEGLIDDFVQAVLTGRPPATTLEQAYVVRELLDCIYASTHQGAAVPYTPLLAPGC